MCIQYTHMNKSKYQFTIDPDEINESHKEFLSKGRTLVDTINDNITDETLKQLCMTVIKNSIIFANKQYLLKFLKKRAPISHNNKMFKTPQSPVMYGINSVYIGDNTVTKIINYRDNPEAEFDIVNEIAMQIYAQKLGKKCNIYVPKILNYGKVILPAELLHDIHMKYGVVHNETCFYYVTMEKIDDTPLEYIANNASKEVCETLINKANEASKCLTDNNFYHNDFHANNVFVDENNELTLLDYGNATLYEEGYAKSTDNNEKFGANKITVKCRNKGGSGYKRSKRSKRSNRWHKRSNRSNRSNKKNRMQSK